jgi:hypothetical protein
MQDPMKKRSLEDMKKSADEGMDRMDIDSATAMEEEDVCSNKLEDVSNHKPAAARLDLMTLLRRPSPFANETGALPIGEFEPQKFAPNVTTADMVDSALTHAKVLVVGAGGLGCELLKNLALSGIANVHVIDLDTIDVTNLNRQFLFRRTDVGSSKAQVAAAFINARCPWMKVTAHHGMIQDKDSSFYKSFNCIISGLDNVEARRWLNSCVSTRKYSMSCVYVYVVKCILIAFLLCLLFYSSSSIFLYIVFHTHRFVDWSNLMRMGIRILRRLFP